MCPLGSKQRFRLTLGQDSRLRPPEWHDAPSKAGAKRQFDCQDGLIPGCLVEDQVGRIQRRSRPDRTPSSRTGRSTVRAVGTALSNLDLLTAWYL